jgi:hypothetical protein
MPKLKLKPSNFLAEGNSTLQTTSILKTQKPFKNPAFSKNYTTQLLKLNLPYKTSLFHWNVATSLVPEQFTATKRLSQFSFSMLTSEGNRFCFSGRTGKFLHY